MISIRAVAVAALAMSAAASLAAQRPMTPAERDSARSGLAKLRLDAPGVHISLDSIIYGSRVIGRNELVTGDVAVFHGTLDVAGAITGDAIAIDGRIVLRNGARVSGDVIALGGGVENQGATVGGETHALGGFAFDEGLRRIRQWHSPFAAVHGPRARGELLGAWFVLLSLIGLATAFFARSNLEQIADRVQDDFSKAFLFGLLGQLAILPGMIVVTIALALTIVGVLVIPFAVVGIVLAAAGALALGFVAVAYVTGTTFLARRSSATQAAQCVLAGLVVYTLLWAIAAVPQWGGVLGNLVRLAAVVMTWAAVTVGFGATILARGGTRGAFTSAIPVPASADDDLSWQTPTPVSGVAAARRPTPASRSAQP